MRGSCIQSHILTQDYNQPSIPTPVMTSFFFFFFFFVFNMTLEFATQDVLGCLNTILDRFTLLILRKISGESMC